eukprot:5301193-Amphidinium_carterae.1
MRATTPCANSSKSFTNWVSCPNAGAAEGCASATVTIRHVMPSSRKFGNAPTLSCTMTTTGLSAQLSTSARYEMEVPSQCGALVGSG